MELNARTECGIFNVPDLFVGTVLQCDMPADPSACHKEGPNGYGVYSDFLIFVGTNSQQSSE